MKHVGRQFTNRFVTKIPRDFLRKTLKRLSPPTDHLASLLREELIKLATLREEIKRLIEIDPARFFLPNPGGQEAFLKFDDPLKTILFFFAGNKGGKTTAGALRFGERLLGRPLWGLESRSFSYPVPARGACFAEDFDSHKEITIPTIRSWFPSGSIKREWRNSQGHITEMELSNSSLIHFRSYDQGSDKAEGKDWDIVWCDEPPPRDVYVAMRRGLVVSNGTCIITATLIKEAWLYDEAEENVYVQIFEGSIHDNLWLSPEGKMAFLSSLDEQERAVREQGKPASLVGLVYPEFKAEKPFIEDLLEIPEEWPVIMGVDPHERKPVYVMYGIVTPDDEIIWFHYLTVRGAPSEIFKVLDKHEAEFPQGRPVLTLMDPNRGRAIQINGRSWDMEFEEQGYSVYLGVDDVHFGHSCVREYLKYDPTDPESKPRMRFSRSCLGKGGPIHQMLRYSWDDFHNRKDRDLKEKTKDRNKDFPDIVRYTCVAEPTFSDLKHGPKIIDRRPDDWKRHHGLRAGGGVGISI